MRLAYTSDLHGDLGLYRAALAWAHRRGADLLVFGGDLLPHSRSVQAQVDFVRRSLRVVLRSSAVPVYAVVGNDDWAGAYPALQDLEAAGLLTLLDHRAVAGPGGWTLIGYPGVPPTPFYMKDHDRRDLPTDGAPAGSGLVSQDGGTAAVDLRAWLGARPSIAEELAALPRPRDPGRTIYVLHSPPHATALDRIAGGQPVGSRAARAFLAACGAPLALHGHIHEAPLISGRYWERLGATLCVNPGQGAPLHGVLVDPAQPEATLEHTLFRGPDSGAGL